jgi:hypothetical protein
MVQRVEATAPLWMSASLQRRLPASYYQEQHARYATGGASNLNLVVALRFRGPLDLRALTAAVDELVARHEALRTTLTVSASGVEQLVWDSMPLEIERQEVEDPHDPLSSSAPQSLIAVHADRPFELDGQPLLRAVLLAAGPQDHTFALVLHHAITDAWSCEVLTDELELLYRTRVLGQPSPLAAVAPQFAQHALWERCGAAPGWVDRAVEHWWQELGHRGGGLCLPISPEWALAPVSSVRFDPLPRIPAAEVQQLARLARAHRASTTMALVAALAGALAPYARDTITLGLVHANRYEPEETEIVGPCLDITPLRLELSSTTSFLDLLVEARRAWLGALEHRMPFGALHRLTGGPGGWYAHDLFDVTVNHMPYRRPPDWERAHPVTGLRIERVPVPLRLRDIRFAYWFESPRPFYLFLTEDPEGALEADLATDGRLLPPDAIEELGRVWARTLRRVLEDPRRSLRSA